MHVVMIATIMIVIVRVAMMIEIRNVVIKIVVVVTIRAHDLIKDMTTVATKQSMMIDDKTLVTAISCSKLLELGISKSVSITLG